MNTQKICSVCKETKELSFFGKNAGRKDGLNSCCKVCHTARTNKYRKEHYNVLPDKELKKTYENRKETISIALKAKYEADDTYREKISKSSSKSIYSIDVLNNQRQDFASAIEAKRFGYDNANISTAIRTGTIYKNKRWYFNEK